MNLIKNGDIVSVRHYSGVNPFKSIVVDSDEDHVKIKLTKDFAIMNFLEGDPVVIGVESEGNVKIFGCKIVEINIKDGIIEVSVDKIDSEAEQRRHERFPVSLYADVRVKMDKKKHLAAIKDISFYGMLIFSKSEFSVGEELELDIYMEKNMLFLKCEVMRKVPGDVYNKYGVRIIYRDVNSMNFVKEYLKRLKEVQEETIRKMKE
ncbi:MAG: PilZ domain protein [Firmicutes bacterium ADurb.Bin419]|nr:MAG: PilZ domain protein [Firmicutes bacterium ADurb.Bin419]